MYLNILFLPLCSALLCGFGGRWLGPQGASRLSVSAVSFAALLSFFIFYEVGVQGSNCYIYLAPWIQVDTLEIPWGFLFDALTASILVLVTCISALVHLYSTEYIGEDPHLTRFLSYLSLFTFFMLILVTADNFVQIFIGWEGVGLCSYLLINFWFTRIQANKAAIKAIVVNRIGDLGLVLGIFTIFICFDAVDYGSVFSLAPSVKNQSFEFLGISWDCIHLISFLLFIGAIGKSAQLGLHTWLPDAMEGPTPVSALIHAATMVTAGVFLLARCSPLLEFGEGSLAFITIIGAITAFFAATVGVVQNDVKRVVAYSTCSQLGYMIFACGLSNYTVGVFHLINHGFFKAALFLGAGSIIHGVGDEQDIRKIGGLRRLLPLTYAVIVIASFSLMGFPFLTGFYSKDVILEVAYAKYTTFGHFAYVLGSAAAFLTAFYSLRLVYLCFLSAPNGFRPIIAKAHESPWQIWVPLCILIFPSIFLGYLLKDLFLGLGTPFWGNAIFTSYENANIIDAEFLPTGVKLLPVILSILGALLSFTLYSFYRTNLFEVKRSMWGRSLYTFFNRKWFFDKVYNDWLNQSMIRWSYKWTYLSLDRGLIEMLGPFGLIEGTYSLSTSMRNLQGGQFFHGAFVFLWGGFSLGVIALVINFPNPLLFCLPIIFLALKK